MPVIQFDVLVPAEPAEALRLRFLSAGEKLAQAGVLAAMEVGCQPDPQLPEGVLESLRQTYRDDHDGRDLVGANAVRYRLEPQGFSGSVNQLAMALSRLLTPAVELPDDPVLLENELAFELPAAYPWWVEILR